MKKSDYPFVGCNIFLPVKECPKAIIEKAVMIKAFTGIRERKVKKSRQRDFDFSENKLNFHLMKIIIVAPNKQWRKVQSGASQCQGKL